MIDTGGPYTPLARFSFLAASSSFVLSATRSLAVDIVANKHAHAPSDTNKCTILLYVSKGLAVSQKKKREAHSQSFSARVKSSKHYLRLLAAIVAKCFSCWRIRTPRFCSAALQHLLPMPTCNPDETVLVMTKNGFKVLGTEQAGFFLNPAFGFLTIIHKDDFISSHLFL